MDYCFKGEEATRGQWGWEELSPYFGEISRQHAKLIDKWIGECVSKWCYEAARLFDERRFDEAWRELESRGFSLAVYHDYYEFLQNDVPLARCSVALTFTEGVYRCRPEPCF